MNELTVFEFDKIFAGKDGENLGKNQLTKADFKELKGFVCTPDEEADNDGEEAESANTVRFTRDASVCLKLGTENGKEVVSVRNYVGIISLSSGTLIEILPKTAADKTDNEIKFARECVVRMLYSAGNITYKSFQHANLEALREMNLYEVYIRLFLDELNELYKKGLKAGYVPHEDNENFLKGKLLFNEHVKRNFAHKEKFYVGYETFNFDRVENRLIKSTLLYLKSKSKEDGNRRDIRRMLLNFDEITPSQNYDGDFKRCTEKRIGREYSNVLALCKIFLARKSFTMYDGKSEATALLFPMDKLFERYIAKQMEPVVRDMGWDFSDQDRGEYLLSQGGERKFPLRPDIVLYSKNGERVIIDTKWKRLHNDPKQNYGISQADMYQMYAYHTRYKKVKTVVLLYPLYEKLAIADYNAQVGAIGVKIKIRTFDLYKYIKGKRGFFDCIDKIDELY